MPTAAKSAAIEQMQETINKASAIFLADFTGLDVAQMSALRAEEMQAAVRAGGFFQEVKYFVAACVLAFLGHGALKTAKAVGSGKVGRSKDSPGIVSSAG